MTSIEIITPPTLDELAASINHEHSLVETSIQTALIHALAAGEALLEARRSIPVTKTFKAWVEANLDITQTTAGGYIRLAHYRDQLDMSQSINGARKSLMGMPAVEHPMLHRLQIRELRSQGLKHREIAEEVGVPMGSIGYHLADNKKRDKWNQLRRQRAINDGRQRAAADAALRRQERNAAMKNAGGDAWDAYLLTRKLAPLLESLKLNSAYHHCITIEDELVKRVKGQI